LRADISKYLLKSSLQIFFYKFFIVSKNIIHLIYAAVQVQIEKCEYFFESWTWIYDIRYNSKKRHFRKFEKGDACDY
jgi:hypothetical protein